MSEKKNECLEGLIGVDLSSFVIKRLIEVYKFNEDISGTISVGFFEDEKIARGFVKIQRGFSLYDSRPKIVLTDGKIGVSLGSFINILSDKEAKFKIAEKGRAKLSEEEAYALGLK